MVSLSVQKAQDGQELFDVLIDAYPDLPPKALKTAFKKKIITVNDTYAYADDVVSEGDLVDIYTTGDKLGIDLSPQILYEDENLLIIDKPAGLPATPQSDEPSVIVMIEEYMKQRGEYSLQALMVPYLIYPLDKYVSGVLLIAKHEDAYMFFIEALGQRRIARFYICAVKGCPDDQEELFGYHKRDRLGRRAHILKKHKKGDKPIVTRCKKISQGNNMALLRARPITNGLHQVRAHLADCGLPILGDGIYGDRRFNMRFGAEYICLWLETLVFEVGTGHGYDYINGKCFSSRFESFPVCVYDQGLMDIADE